MPFDPHLTEARLAIGDLHPEDMPALAADALEAGLDGPTIRRLAGLIRPSGWEVDQLIPSFMAETHLQVTPAGIAGTRIAADLIRHTLTCGTNPVPLCAKLERLWIQAGCPSALSEAGNLEDELYLMGLHSGTHEGSAKDVHDWIMQRLQAVLTDIETGNDAHGPSLPGAAEKTMIDTRVLANHYQTLTNAQLLVLSNEGGLIDEAVPVLRAELKRRQLQDSDWEHYKVPDEILLREQTREKRVGWHGPALRFFGRLYLSEADRQADVQVRTKWFALAGIPLVPLASYRFLHTRHPSRWFETMEHFKPLNRIPLNWHQVLLTWLKTALVLLGIVLLVVGIDWFERVHTR